MRDDHARELARLAEQQRLNTPTRRPKDAALSPGDVRTLSGVSPEAHRPNITAAAIRVLGNAPAADLTKRELFAAVILAGLSISGQPGNASTAVALADEMIAALDASSA